MKKSSGKIAFFTTVQGHYSLSSAAEETISKKFQVSTYFDTDSFFIFYILIYKYAPFIFGGPFRAASQERLLRFVLVFFRHRYYDRVAAFIEEEKPILLVNFFWMYKPCLEEISRQKNLPLLNVIADTWSSHPTSVAKAPGLNLTFDKKTSQHCQELDKQTVCQEIGWLVRNQFETLGDKMTAKEALGIEPETLVILFTSGSEGMRSIVKIIKEIKTKKPVEIIVSCGNSDLLLKEVTGLKKHLPPSSSVKITAIPFTPHLEKYMQAADLVVGKAGPNTLFESVATLTPFLATSHIAGQEDGNLEIIKDYNLGYVEENSQKAVALITHIINTHEVLEIFKEPLKTLAAYNARSGERLLEIINQQLKANRVY